MEKRQRSQKQQQQKQYTPQAQTRQKKIPPGALAKVQTDKCGQWWKYYDQQVDAEYYIHNNQKQKTIANWYIPEECFRQEKPYPYDQIPLKKNKQKQQQQKQQKMR